MIKPLTNLTKRKSKYKIKKNPKTKTNPKGAGIPPSKEPRCVKRKELEKIVSATGGVVSSIARICGVTPFAVYTWIDRYDWMQDAMHDVHEENLDIAETSLMNLVKKHDLGACIFYLKCKGKKRGYVERQVFQFDPNPYQELNDDDLTRRIEATKNRITKTL